MHVFRPPVKPCPHPILSLFLCTHPPLPPSSFSHWFTCSRCHQTTASVSRSRLSRWVAPDCRGSRSRSCEVLWLASSIPRAYFTHESVCFDPFAASYQDQTLGLVGLSKKKKKTELLLIFDSCSWAAPEWDMWSIQVINTHTHDIDSLPTTAYVLDLASSRATCVWASLRDSIWSVFRSVCLKLMVCL